MYDTSHTYCTFYNETPIVAYIWFTTHTSRDVFYLTPLNVADKFDTRGFDTFTTYIPPRAIMRSRFKSTSIYPKKYQTYETALWFLKARYAVIMQLLDIIIIIIINPHHHHHHHHHHHQHHYHTHCRKGGPAVVVTIINSTIRSNAHYSINFIIFTSAIRAYPNMHTGNSKKKTIFFSEQNLSNII